MTFESSAVSFVSSVFDLFRGRKVRNKALRQGLEQGTETVVRGEP